MKLRPQIKWYRPFNKGSLLFKFWTKENKYMPKGYEKFVDIRDSNGLVNYLIERTNHRDDLFKQIEMAVLGNDRSEALRLAREGWQLSGR